MIKYESTQTIEKSIKNQIPWKICFMELVDDFRATKDFSLIEKEPKLENCQEKALLCSIVLALCNEQNIEAPAWAWEKHFLPKPWFVSGIKNLYATAIIESPVWFKKNNIFVLGNFLNRV